VAVKRIVPNIAAAGFSAAIAFYRDILGMTVAMDMGWIVTFASDSMTTPQLSVASEGGGGTAVPDISLEVDDLDAVHRKVVASRIAVEYGPSMEPWGFVGSTCAIRAAGC
jgi:catechol 2,3-dioxygenase-like lactoylglutathione lyase family enzyme